MKAHEKKWTHEGPCKNKKNKISHAQNIRRERQKHGTPYPLSTPSTTYPHTCTSRSWLYNLLTLWVQSLTLQNIWNEYVLVFLPTLSSTKAFRSRRKKGTQKALVRIQTHLSELECHSRNLFLFLKTSGCNLEQGMGKWCFMNRSISQPPKTR